MDGVAGTRNLPSGFSIQTDNSDIDYYFVPAKRSRKVQPASPVIILGKLWFYEKGRDPNIDQVGYSEQVISIKIDLSSWIEKYPGQTIRLCYEDPISNEWVFFERQYEKEIDEKKYLIVEFNFWHPDPGIGWGFT